MLTRAPDWIRNISEADQLSCVSSHKVLPAVSSKLVIENVSTSLPPSISVCTDAEFRVSALREKTITSPKVPTELKYG